MGSVLGSPPYMAPEQAAGRADLDARSDLYSLGGVAYFLLTGQPPFVKETALEMMLAHAYETPKPPSEVRPGLPADLEEVILRCLKKKPDERYPDADSLEKALAALRGRQRLDGGGRGGVVGRGALRGGAGDGRGAAGADGEAADDGVRGPVRFNTHRRPALRHEKITYFSAALYPLTLANGCRACGRGRGPLPCRGPFPALAQDRRHDPERNHARPARQAAPPVRRLRPALRPGARSDLGPRSPHLH